MISMHTAHQAAGPKKQRAITQGAQACHGLPSSQANGIILRADGRYQKIEAAEKQAHSNPSCIWGARESYMAAAAGGDQECASQMIDTDR